MFFEGSCSLNSCAVSLVKIEVCQVRESDGKQVDNAMKNNIEGIIIKWAHQVSCSPAASYFLLLLHRPTSYYCFLPQVDEVLSKESEEQLLEGLHPGPMTEIEFWEAK